MPIQKLHPISMLPTDNQGTCYRKRCLVLRIYLGPSSTCSLLLLRHPKEVVGHRTIVSVLYWSNMQQWVDGGSVATLYDLSRDWIREIWAWKKLLLQDLRNLVLIALIDHRRRLVKVS